MAANAALPTAGTYATFCVTVTVVGSAAVEPSTAVTVDVTVTVSPDAVNFDPVVTITTFAVPAGITR